ncbi:MAG TPA: heparinase II/III family protein [Planctomycetota bacterium]|nr:heparinase II/III family protein [Planctomycetota bacterium]
MSSPLFARLSREHPRLLGTRAELKKLAKARPAEYARTVEVARTLPVPRTHDSHQLNGKIPSLGLVAAIEEDRKLAREAVDLVMDIYVNKPVRTGHVPFGWDVAHVAMIYDMCQEAWTDAERRKFFAYMSECREKNMGEEPSVFHNGWYGYKMWGFGLGALTTYYENPAAEKLYVDLDRELRERAVPGLEAAGDGGGWAEGYYIHYWCYEWLFFCECARRCAGIDYFALAPKFYRQRAIASMFEMYPRIFTPTAENTIGSPGKPEIIAPSYRPVPMGDGGGRTIHPERDKALNARRILVGVYRDDPAHQAVNAFNQTTPNATFSYLVHRDLLWKDDSIPVGDLKKFKLSHYSPGPGFVYARSSWEQDAAYLFFHCGRRFTSHQHLDNAHFVIFKHEELLGDGGHYEAFSGDHDVNYYLRSIAHNTMLVHDPSEGFSNFIRANKFSANDGGQAYPWPGTPFGHNGGAWDLDGWNRNKDLGDIGSIVAYEDAGDYVYTAGDATRSYSAKKLEYFTRQIVFIRPGTFVIFDRVKSTNASFKKTFLLQAMKTPERKGRHLVITNGNGRLFIQTLLPLNAETKLNIGDEQYKYGGHDFTPTRRIEPAPECRVDVSPSHPSQVDYFLHVLTATDATVQTVPEASVSQSDTEVSVTVGEWKLGFTKHSVGGWTEHQGNRRNL